MEMFFSCLKTRGFRLEETHMSDLEKTKKLIALLALALLWYHRLGEEKEEPIKVKKHGKKVNNLSRYGLDYLRKLISPFNAQLSWFKIAMSLFEQNLSTITLKIIT